MDIRGQDTLRHQIGPVTNHLMEKRKAIAGVEGDVFMTGALREAGRSGVGPRGLRGEPEGIPMYDGGRNWTEH